MTWMVACSHGMRLPLCQIFEVVWIGMRVRKLLQSRLGRIFKGTANRVCVSPGPERLDDIRNQEFSLFPFRCKVRLALGIQDCGSDGRIAMGRLKTDR